MGGRECMGEREKERECTKRKYKKDKIVNRNKL